jgi:hypothetical protein
LAAALVRYPACFSSNDREAITEGSSSTISIVAELILLFHAEFDIDLDRQVFYVQVNLVFFDRYNKSDNPVKDDL